MQNISKKKRVKNRCKKREKSKVSKKVTINVSKLVFKRGIYFFSTVIDGSSRMTFSFFFFFNFCVELNISLIEARLKAHNKPINAL